MCGLASSSDHLLWVIQRRGPLPLPRICLGARGGPDHCPASGTRPRAHRGEGCCPINDVHGRASGFEELETEVGRRALIWVSCRTMKIIFPCVRLLLFPNILSCFSTKHQAHEPSFTSTKAVKRGVGSSAGASSRPHAAQETTQEATEVAQLTPGALAKPDSTATEAVFVGLVPPTEAIPVSSGEETEVGDTAPTVASPTISDSTLLRAQGRGSSRRSVPRSQ